MKLSESFSGALRTFAYFKVEPPYKDWEIELN